MTRSGYLGKVLYEDESNPSFRVLCAISVEHVGATDSPAPLRSDRTVSVENLLLFVIQPFRRPQIYPVFSNDRRREYVRCRTQYESKRFCDIRTGSYAAQDGQRFLLVHQSGSSVEQEQLREMVSRDLLDLAHATYDRGDGLGWRDMHRFDAAEPRILIICRPL